MTNADAPTTAELPTVYQIVPRVKGAIGSVGKNKVMKEGEKYQYRSIDDMLDAAHEGMVEHGLFFAPITYEFTYTDFESKRGAKGVRVLGHVIYRVYGPRGDHLEPDLKIPAEANDYSDKATNKAMTAAEKILLAQLFAIPFSAPDPDDERVERDTPTAPRERNADGLVGPSDLAELEAMMAGLTEAEKAAVRAQRVAEGISIKTGEFTIGGLRRIVELATEVVEQRGTPAEPVETVSTGSTTGTLRAGGGMTVSASEVRASAKGVRETAERTAAEAPGPLAAAPARAMTRTAAAIEATPDPVEQVESVLGTTEEMVTQIHHGNLVKLTDTLGPEKTAQLKGWMTQEGIDARPSKLTVANYQRIMERAATMQSSPNMRGRGARPTPPVPDAMLDQETLEYRGLLVARVADMGEEYEGAFEETLKLQETNPHKGMPWRQQLDRLPVSWNPWLTDQVEQLESAWVQDQADSDPVTEPEDDGRGF